MRKQSIFDCRNIDFHLNHVDYNSSIVGRFHTGHRNNWELIYKINGRSMQYFGDVVIDLVPNSVYFIPAGTINSFTVLESGTVVNIHFELLGAASEQNFPPELIKLELGNRYKSQFLRAAAIWQKKETAYYLRAHAIVSEIFAGLVSDQEQQYMQSKKYAHIVPALNHISRNYQNPITVAELAELCGISDEYLRVLFKNYIGLTPLSYINTLRLERARELLMSSGITVSGAAEACGFKSPGYFSRLFKKRYNISPGSLNHSEIVLPDLYFKEEYRL